MVSRPRMWIRRLRDRFIGIDTVVWNAFRDFRMGFRRSRTCQERPETPSSDVVLLVVTPFNSVGSGGIPGCGDYFYEILTSAQERYGKERVHEVRVPSGATRRQWQLEIMSELQRTKATHLLTHVEHDPAGLHEWSWDVFADELHAGWRGTWLALFLDSAHRRHLQMAQRLPRRYSKTVVLALDQDLGGLLPKPLVCVGPVFLPISNASCEVIARASNGIQRDCQLTFVGRLYPERRDYLAGLARSGVDILTNPHRGDNDPPNYLQFITALAKGVATLNLSNCNGLDTKQLKSRMLEAPLAGTVAVSDEIHLSSRFFKPGEEFIYFCDASDLKRQIETVNLAAMAERARTAARHLAPICFWREIESALKCQ